MSKYNNEIVGRIDELKTRFNVSVLGEVKYGDLAYPIFRIIAKGDDNPAEKRDILLSGIVHGDEPAGGLAILDFLKNSADKYLDRFNFYCYPCVNPGGFENEIRENPDGLNLNRNFKEKTNAQEVKLVMDSLKNGPKRYHFTVDLHECPLNVADPSEGFSIEDNPKEFWMWEGASVESGLRIGDKVVAQLAKEGVPICAWPTIFNDINTNGVIWYPEGNRNEVYKAGTSFEGYLFDNYTNHSFTAETPTGWTLEGRIKVHIRALELMLEFSI